jgi:hypothetical protein
MTVVNLKQIAKNVQKFYLSGNQSGNIIVKLNEPCNENITINVTRLSTFQETLTEVYSKINLYLSNIHKITYSNMKYTLNNIKSKNLILNHIHSHHFNKYLVSNNLSGEYDA